MSARSALGLVWTARAERLHLSASPCRPSAWRGRQSTSGAAHPAAAVQPAGRRAPELAPAAVELAGAADSCWQRSAAGSHCQRVPEMTRARPAVRGHRPPARPAAATHHIQECHQSLAQLGSHGGGRGEAAWLCSGRVNNPTNTAEKGKRLGSR